MFTASSPVVQTSDLIRGIVDMFSGLKSKISIPSLSVGPGVEVSLAVLMAYIGPMPAAIAVFNRREENR